jgi:hypothetical protein
MGVSGWTLQVLAKSPMQGVKVNVFDGGLVPISVGPILSGSAFSLAHAHPVGGSVSSARKTITLYKGLQQINGMAVFGLPIAAEALGNPAQNVAG